MKRDLRTTSCVRVTSYIRMLHETASRTFDKLDDFTIKHHCQTWGPADDDTLRLSFSFFFNFPISLNIMIEWGLIPHCRHTMNLFRADNLLGIVT